MPNQDLPINGSAGNSAVMTTWGACRLHDLARLTESRDRAQQQREAIIAATQASQVDILAVFDSTAANLLAETPEADRPALAEAQAAERSALVAEQAAFVAKMQADAAQDYTARLPSIIVDDNTTVPCLGVVAVGETASVIDVTILQVSVGDPPEPVDLVVRCGTAALFVTQNGYVAASDVDGETINLQPSDTFVAVASIVQLNEPITMYRVQCDSDTCCIGADSTTAARVRVVG